MMVAETTAKERSIGSILVADCGTITTKVALFEQVAGRYRFAARGEALSTTGPPWSDVSEGIRRAVEQIIQVTGRRLFDESGDLISPEMAGHQGVDAFVATVSAAQPLSVVLAGLVPDLSIASAKRAAAGTYSLVKAVLSGDVQNKSSEASHMRTVRQAAPDVICIAGGTDGGAAFPVLELTQTIALACSMIDEEVRPRLLYMGNSQLRRRIVNIVKGRVELRVTDNVRPTLTEEDLTGAQAELEVLYTQNKMGLLPGIEVANSWSSPSLIPTASAFNRLIQYLWHLREDSSKGVIGIDIGAASTTIAAAFDGQPFLTINGGLGATFGAQRLMDESGAEIITRWLPEPMSDEEALGILINKEVHPQSIGQETRELHLEQALAREAIRATLRTARPGWVPSKAQLHPQLLPLCDTIVVSGGILAQAPHPGQAALVVLDALEPIGITTLVLDIHGIAPALGSVAAVKPLAAVEALDSGALVNLATVIAPIGQARPGDVILKAKVTYEGNGSLEVEVHYGDLEVLPLPPGQQATLELQPTRRHKFDVGLGGPGKGGQQRVSGGLAGLIIDARGRPLRFPRTPERRRNKMQQWLWDIGG